MENQWKLQQALEAEWEETIPILTLYLLINQYTNCAPHRNSIRLKCHCFQQIDSWFADTNAAQEWPNKLEYCKLIDYGVYRFAERRYWQEPTNFSVLYVQNKTMFHKTEEIVYKYIVIMVYAEINQPKSQTFPDLQQVFHIQ